MASIFVFIIINPFMAENKKLQKSKKVSTNIGLKGCSERNSGSSISSVKTTFSQAKDPKEFLLLRGYEIKHILATGGFSA